MCCGCKGEDLEFCEECLRLRTKESGNPEEVCPKLKARLHQHQEDHAQYKLKEVRSNDVQSIPREITSPSRI